MAADEFGCGNNTEWMKGGAKLRYGKKKVSELHVLGTVYGQARSCRRQVAEPTARCDGLG